MRVKTRIYAGGLLLLGMLVMPDLSGQSVYINMGKGWSYITGAQRAVNDSNRVNYSVDKEFPCGRRVRNFETDSWIDQHDSDFVKFHLDANEVFDANKTVEGPSFFISQFEVTNGQYKLFVEECIQNWMKENRPEIVLKYKWESAEYVQAVQAWLSSNLETMAVNGGISVGYAGTMAQTWGELYLKKLDWKKVTYNGIPVYPNTEVWIRDFIYSVNEPMSYYYFIHPKYADYPVVGVSQIQAEHFCNWYTSKNPKSVKSQDDNYTICYRLPTETEWERAAAVVSKKRSKKSSGSPANNNFMRNSQGCFIANFKPGTHDFGIDGSVYPTNVDSYWPNDAGCFNMQGNVAEWTCTSLSFPRHFSNGQNSQKGYIVKGGAWNLPEAACTVGSRTVFSEDYSTSYVGFRMVAVPMKKFRPLITPEF